MTIFGFNTDVKHEDTVYHVQSEASQNDLLLQTLVFVKGQCVAKHAFSYAHKISETHFSNEAMHELLKAQHKTVVEEIRAGRIAAMADASPEVQDVGGAGLALTLISMERESDGETFLLRLQVTDSGQPVSPANVKCWVRGVADLSGLANATTGATGHAEMHVPANEELIRVSAVMVQAVFGEKSATRKFRIRK
jgi:hypothetical protein